jgi:glycerol-1-phosphate dehydrogenase [NAD(P)+]
MMRAGLGDMLAKYVAICEWRISNLINGEEYWEDVADMVRASLKKCVDGADGLLARDKTAVEAVFEGLALCGAAMKIAGTSRPASGVEHYLSHVWDMRGEAFHTPVALHGMQCAVGTYIAVGIYEKIKKITPNRQKAIDYVEGFDYSSWAEALRAFVGKGAEAMIALEAKEGKYDVEKHAKRLDRIIEKWDEILRIIQEELPSITELTALYDKIGLPRSMREIGLDEDTLPMTFKATKDIRDKYVLSRLCWDLGVLDEII